MTVTCAFITGHYSQCPLLKVRGQCAAITKHWDLTPRQKQVIAAIAAGKTNKEIGQEMKIAVNTVKRHLTDIFDRVGASNRAELIAMAFKHRAVSIED
jgi:two-component system nitrate/nitrite response regulator NarL